MKYIPRLKSKYVNEVIPKLKEELGISNIMAVPKLVKICINRGIGSVSSDKKLLEIAVSELSDIAGQKAVIRKTNKSISNFKLREGAVVGCMVTLRGDKMYEFFDRLVNVSLPRVRDFKGVSKDSFDNSGVYNLGIKEQIIFPEIKIDKVVRMIGMNVSFVTNTNDKRASFCLLKLLGMPFKI